MTTIRRAEIGDAEMFMNLLYELDNETKFMLFEPGERKTDCEKTKSRIEEANKSSLLLLAEDEGRAAGFLSANRGSANRVRHSAYIVIGILKQYSGRGIGKRMFQSLEQWARESGIIRLELTVMAHNENAIGLYKSMGFKIEGLKEKSCMVDGKYVDEYYMAKILAS